MHKQITEIWGIVMECEETADGCRCTFPQFDNLSKSAPTLIEAGMLALDEILAHHFAKWLRLARKPEQQQQTLVAVLVEIEPEPMPKQSDKHGSN